MDTKPPRSFRPRKFLVKERDLKHPLRDRYYRRGGYVCDECRYGDNKTCGMCIFARWNVDGVQAGFSPSEAYRKAHRDDLRSSPLIQRLETDKIHRTGRLDLLTSLPMVDLPPVRMTPRMSQLVIPSYNNISRLVAKLREVRRNLG